MSFLNDAGNWVSKAIEEEENTTYSAAVTNYLNAVTLILN